MLRHPLLAVVALASISGPPCSQATTLPELVVLARDPKGPEAMALDESHVYWADQETISRVAKRGGRSLRLVAAGAGAVFVHLRRLYFLVPGALGDDRDLAIRGGVFRVPTVGGAKEKLFVPRGGGVLPTFVQGGESGTMGFQDLAAFGSALYWVNVLDNTVIKLDFNSRRRTTLARDQEGPVALVVDRDHVYWASSAAHQIRRVAVSGGSVSTLATAPDLGEPTQIALDDEYVYWPVTRGGQIQKARKTGGSPATCAMTQQQEGPIAVAVDESHVYWATAASGTIVAIAKTGGDPVCLAKNLGAPRRLSIDRESVYFTDIETGIVGRIDKPWLTRAK